MVRAPSFKIPNGFFSCNFPYEPLNSTLVEQQCLSLLKHCSSMEQFSQIHALLQTSGLHGELHVVNELLRFCASSPSADLSYAYRILHHTDGCAPSSCNILIRAYVARHSPRGAIRVYHRMRNLGIEPNQYTFPFLFNACAALLALEAGKQVQADALKYSSDSDGYVLNSLINFYGHCHEVLHARKVFDEMPLRTIVSWNSIITACVMNLRIHDSVELFLKMRRCGFDPNEITMVVLLSACSQSCKLSLGRRAHALVILKGMTMNCHLGTALVDMYAKCGAVAVANKVFDRMPMRNVQTWSAMVVGLAQHGFAQEALQLFLKMKRSITTPNCVTFLGVLCACSHVGLVDDGYRYLHEMERVYSIKPSLAHYGAMVDLLCRAGRLKEAFSFIMNMPIKADAVMWRTLLGASMIGDVNDEDGVMKMVRRKLLEMEPRCCDNFVMVANLYAEVGMWEKSAKLRRLMRAEGLKKVAGESYLGMPG